MVRVKDQIAPKHPYNRLHQSKSSLEHLSGSTNHINGNQPPKSERFRRNKDEIARGLTIEQARAERSKLATASPDRNGTDRVAGEASGDKSSETEEPRFSGVNKETVTDLRDFVVERNFLKQAQPWVDRINAGFDDADEAGRNLLRICRATGILLLEWKALVGHGNWQEAYRTSGFKKSLDTAQHWMLLSFLTDAQIDEVSTLEEAVEMAKEEKKLLKGKGKGGKAGSRMDDVGDTADGNATKKATTPDPPDPDQANGAPDPPSEPPMIMDELEKAVKAAVLTQKRETLEAAIKSMLDEYYSTPAAEWEKAKEPAATIE